MSRARSARESIRSTICVAQLMSSRALITASEKLQWPTPVNYAAASPEDRKEFETAFSNLIRLQMV